jgi:hypothetical protein
LKFGGGSKLRPIESVLANIADYDCSILSLQAERERERGRESREYRRESRLKE